MASIDVAAEVAAEVSRESWHQDFSSKSWVNSFSRANVAIPFDYLKVGSNSVSLDKYPL